MIGTAPVTEPIEVFLVDDHAVVREGLVALLGREPDLRVVGMAENAERALELLQTSNPQVIVLDHRLPGMDGVMLCRRVAELRLRAQVVMLSAFMDDESVLAAFHAGARAYVLKDVELGQLVHAIRAAARGETVMDTKVSGRFVPWTERSRTDVARYPSPAHIKILRRLVEGRSVADIALLTGLSPMTVRSYLRAIYKELGVHSRSEAASIAVRRGLV